MLDDHAAVQMARSRQGASLHANDPCAAEDPRDIRDFRVLGGEHERATGAEGDFFRRRARSPEIPLTSAKDGWASPQKGERNRRRSLRGDPEGAVRCAHEVRREGKPSTAVATTSTAVGQCRRRLTAATPRTTARRSMGTLTRRGAMGGASITGARYGNAGGRWRSITPELIDRRPAKVTWRARATPTPPARGPLAARRRPRSRAARAAHRPARGCAGCRPRAPARGESRCGCR